MATSLFTKKDCKYKRKGICAVNGRYCISVANSDCKKAHDEGKDKIVKDHKGQEYLNLAEMLDAYGVSRPTYDYRKRNGWSLEECLTGKKDLKNTKGGDWYDHLGNAYPTLHAMLKHWGVRERTYYNRLNHGRTLEECLTGVWNRKHHGGGRNRVWKDFNGNIYKTKKDMCVAHNTTVARFDKRIKLGWTLKEALTGKKRELYIDHEGEEFENLEDMLKKHRIPKSTYYSRKRRGWSLEKTLTTPCRDGLEDLDEYD